MPYIVVRHSVADYAKWKPIYDEHGSTRGAAGCKGTQVFRNADQPEEIVVLLEWDSLERARAFTESQALRETMERTGVTGPPDVRFLDRVDNSAQ